MSRNRIIRDATLARQLKADQRARGIARRMSAYLVHHWPEILSLLPQKPNTHWNPQPLRQALNVLRYRLQVRLHRELHGIGSWAAQGSARSLTAAYNRHFGESVLSEDDKPLGAGGITFTPYDSTINLPPRIGDDDYDFRSVLIEPPSAFEIARIVGPTPARLTKLFDPDRVSGTVWQGIASGKNRIEIGRDLRDMLNGDLVAVRRVARTEGARVATQVGLAASEQLADEISGYQIIAVPKTEFSRPDHLRRSGTIYWRHPKSGQKGFDQLPQPPIEADGTVSFNCRCHLQPVWADEPTPEDDGFGRRVDLNGLPIAV